MKVTVDSTIKSQPSIPVSEAVKQEGFFRGGWDGHMDVYIFNGDSGGRGLWITSDNDLQFVLISDSDKSPVYRDYSIDSITISFPEEE